MRRSAQEQAGEADRASAVAVVLDVTFGFLVWAAHFLAIYIAHATACVLGLGEADTGVQIATRVALGAITLAALTVIGVHALGVYRGKPRLQGEFLRNLTLGNDAIACVGVAWQLYPISLIPVCI